jgi:hypothetical protein
VVVPVGGYAFTGYDMGNTGLLSEPESSFFCKKLKKSLKGLSSEELLP